MVLGPASLDVTASGTAVVRAYAGQQGAAISQVVLAESVAAIALAVVVLALGQAAPAGVPAGWATRIQVAGLAAVVLSLVQCAHGVWLAGWVAPYGVFSVARRYDPALDVFLVAETLRPVQAQAGFTVLPNYDFASRPAMNTFLIPGGAGTCPETYNTARKRQTPAVSVSGRQSFQAGREYLPGPSGPVTLGGDGRWISVRRSN